jgi:hypothetical protein
MSVHVATCTLADVPEAALKHTPRSGATVSSVQWILGHASVAMTLDVYSGLFDDDLTSLADRMDATEVTPVRRTPLSVSGAWSRSRWG